MKLALCNEVLARRPLAEQCRLAAALGYQGLEIAPFTLADDPSTLTERDAAGWREAASAHGLAVSSLHWLLVKPAGLSLTSDDAGVRGRTLDLLRQRTLLLEQPLARRVALAEDIRLLDIGVPVILDESDDDDDVFERGLALGYRGISSKACKGLYRSLANAVRVAREPQRLRLSGEDLTCQAGLAVQQDTLLAASLGVTHIERNGHHYVRGFGAAPAGEARAFAAAHPTLYRADGDAAVLAVRDGRLDLSSLHVPGFASSAQPSWQDLIPLH